MNKRSDRQQSRLVADVGGTNIRLGLCTPGDTTVHAITKLRCADYDSLQAALAHYLAGAAAEAELTEACLAIAGPVNDDRVSMTNLPWSFSQNALKQELQLSKLKILNDFAAVAHAVPWLQADELIQIGGASPQPGSPKLAIGPGTGLGMALLAPEKDRYTVFPSEGGHACISAETEQERQIVEYHCQQSDTGKAPCREFFISGRGLAAIYQALGGSTAVSPAEISTAACARQDTLAEQALEIFCGWLGSVCADQALSSGTLGGVYLAGGMLKQFPDFLQQSTFRQRFEDKEQMRSYLESIPCYLITRDHVALLGSAAARL